MIDGDKIYVGTVDNIHKAAIIYDIVSIQTKGLKAKTNFIYRKSELLTILQLKNMVNLREKPENKEEAGKQRSEGGTTQYIKKESPKSNDQRENEEDN